MEMRLDRVLGRRVIALNGRSIGRLEECRARKDPSGWIVTEYVIGAAGLWERLHIGARLVLGLKMRGYVARWDQLALSDTAPIRVTCPVDELRPL